jgi:hypothetical protein
LLMRDCVPEIALSFVLIGAVHGVWLLSVNR